MHKFRTKYKTLAKTVCVLFVLSALVSVVSAVGSRLQAGAAPVASWSFNEGSGSTAYDAIGSSDGIISGASWKNENECKSGKCLNYDGSDDVTTVTQNATINLTSKTAYTIAAWIRPESDGEADTGQIIYKGASTYLRVEQESSGTVKVKASFDLDTTDATVTTTSTIPTLTWSHIVMVYSDDADDEIDLYINGVLNKSSTDGVGSPATDSNNLLIGGTTTANFDGAIDQLAIYNYARSAGQIKSDYQSVGSQNPSSVVSYPSSGTNDGLVGYWKMDESTWTADSADVIDSSGAGNTGTVKGSGTDPVAGKYGKAGSFNGTTDYATIADNDNLDMGINDFTIETWFKSLTSSGDHVIFSDGNPCCIGSPGYAFGINGSTGRPKLYIADATRRLEANGTTTGLSNSAWHHMALIIRNSNDTYEFVIDGISEGLISLGADFASVSNTNASYIGLRTDYAYFNGYIDDLKVYKKIRSANQIKRDYATGPPPVAHWKMDDNVSGASATIKDSAGSNNGTTYGAGTDCTKSGKHGKGCKFAGSAEYISAADSSTLSPIGLISLIGWIRPSAVGVEQTIIGKWDETTGTDDRSYRLWLDASNKLNMSVTTDGSTVVTHTGSNTTFSANTWYHIVGTVDPPSGKMDLYVNGVLDVAQKTSGVPTSIDDNASNLYIGGKENTSGSLDTLFAGIIDDVRIYNYARTPAQIQQDMLGREDWSGGGSQVLAAPRADSGTVGWWDFDEANGSSAYDKSSLSNTLTMTAGGTGVNTAAVNMWDLSNKKYGKSGIEFDGDDYLTRADDSDFDFAAAEDFSVTGWFKHNTISAEQHIINKYSTSASGGYKVWMDSDGDIGFGVDDDTTWTPDDQALTSNKNYDDNNWHQFIGVKTGTSRLDLYIDGVLVASDTSITATGTLVNAAAIYIGVNSDGTSNDWDDSYLDSIKIYRSALSASDAKTLYNRSSSLNLGYQAGADPSTSLESSLVGNPPVGYWSFDERSGTSVQDRSGNNKTGTFNGSWEGQGKYGPSGKFDGADDYVSVGSVSSSVNTVEFWLKPTSTTQKLIDLNATATIDVTAGTVAANNFTSPTIYIDGIATTALANTNWHQVAVTTATDINASAVNIGLIAGSYYSGLIDEVKIYDYARTQQQIAYDYNKGLPVSWWKMDEGSGNTAYDYMKRNNGTLNSGGSGSNATSQDMWDGGVSGKYNRSLEFDGTNDYVSATDTSLPSGTNPKSVSAWIKTSTKTNWGVIFRYGTAVAGQMFWMGTTSSGNIIVTQYGSGVTSSGQDVADNNWHHILVTYNGTNYTIYIDSAIRGGPASMSTNTTLSGSSSIGNSYNQANTQFTGQLDDVRVYNYALSAAQVKKVYNEGSSVRFGPSSGMP